MQPPRSRKPEVRVDLRESTLDEFIDFVFEHPEPERDADGSTKFWRWTIDLHVEIDRARQLALMTELFRGAEELFPRFSAAQIDQGLWLMFSNGREWFTDLLADRDLPWPGRRAAIRAIYDLYDGLLAHVPGEEAGYMLWDMLRDAFNEDCTEVSDACFETLVRILKLPDIGCQMAALHGLGHLKHAQTARVVSEYLQDQAPSDPDLREYAERVRCGEFIL